MLKSVSREACSAWQGSVARIVNPVRNREIFEYQKKVKDARRAFIQKRSDEPSKAELYKSKRDTRHESKLRQWTKKIEAVRQRIENIVDQTHGSCTQK